MRRHKNRTIFECCWNSHAHSMMIFSFFFLSFTPFDSCSFLQNSFYELFHHFLLCRCECVCGFVYVSLVKIVYIQTYQIYFSCSICSSYTYIYTTSTKRAKHGMTFLSCLFQFFGLNIRRLFYTFSMPKLSYEILKNQRGNHRKSIVLKKKKTENWTKQARKYGPKLLLSAPLLFKLISDWMFLIDWLSPCPITIVIYSNLYFRFLVHNLVVRDLYSICVLCLIEFSTLSNVCFSFSIQHSFVFLTRKHTQLERGRENNIPYNCVVFPA